MLFSADEIHHRINADEYLARLARMAPDDIADPYWRRVVVIANAVADAIAGDLKGDPDRNTETLYWRVVAAEGRLNIPTETHDCVLAEIDEDLAETDA